MFNQLGFLYGRDCEGQDLGYVFYFRLCGCKKVDLFQRLETKIKMKVLKIYFQSANVTITHFRASSTRQSRT